MWRGETDQAGVKQGVGDRTVILARNIDGFPWSGKS